MNNTFQLPGQNKTSGLTTVELSLSLMGKVNPFSILADAKDNVCFAEIATNRIVKVEALTYAKVQYN